MIHKFVNKMTTHSSENLLKLCIKLIRVVYIGVAIYYVCYGYYTTILMAKEANLMVKDEVSVLKKYRYPSLTFCYLYKHGVRQTGRTSLDEVSSSNSFDDVKADDKGRKKMKNAANDWKHEGGKNIWWVYHRFFNENWKKSGKERSYISFHIFILEIFYLERNITVIISFCNV